MATTIFEIQEISPVLEVKTGNTTFQFFRPEDLAEEDYFRYVEAQASLYQASSAMKEFAAQEMDFINAINAKLGENPEPRALMAEQNTDEAKRLTAAKIKVDKDLTQATRVWLEILGNLPPGALAKRLKLVPSIYQKLTQVLSETSQQAEDEDEGEVTAVAPQK